MHICKIQMGRNFRLFFQSCVLIFVLTACNGGQYVGTPLHSAASEGNLAEVERLIKNGTSVRVLDENGDQALLRAVLNGHEDVAEYLYERGGSLDYKSKNGSSPADLAQIRPKLAAWMKSHGYKIH